MRLRCRHMFHAACWHSMMEAASRQPQGQTPRIKDDCPNCRGLGAVLAVWDYVDPSLLAQVTALGQLAIDSQFAAHVEPPPELMLGRTSPRSSRASSGRSRFSPAPSSQAAVYTSTGQPHYPVMVDHECGRNLPEARVYHSLTRLADGRPSLLIDPGSVGNLCGENWARSVAAAAKRAGKDTHYVQRCKLLNVRGVGPEGA